MDTTGKARTAEQIANEIGENIYCYDEEDREILKEMTAKLIIKALQENGEQVRKEGAEITSIERGKIYDEAFQLGLKKGREELEAEKWACSQWQAKWEAHGLELVEMVNRLERIKKDSE
jgi:hypothetical protein